MGVMLLGILLAPAKTRSKSAYSPEETVSLPPNIDLLTSLRRCRYIFSVVMAAIHFSIAISQNTENVLDGFTTYAPLVLTVCSCLMSLLFAGYGTGEGIPIELAAM